MNDTNKFRHDTPFRIPPAAIPAAPAAPSRSGGGIVYFLAGILFVAFGAACVFVGMHAMRYIDRLESLEKNADGNNHNFTLDSFSSRSPGELSSRREYAVPSTQAPATATAQPQIYFMMGNQQPMSVPAMAMPQTGQYAGGYPGFGYPGGMASLYQPQIPPFMQPNMHTDLNQFIMSKYQEEFAEYIRQHTNNPASMTFHKGDVWSIPGMSATPASMRRDYISSAIPVPKKMTIELKRRYSSMPEVENWLQKETAANREILEDDLDDDTDLDPQMDAILRTLAETTFADKQYERTARVYAELASRSVDLSVAELMCWSKACELASDIDAALRILNLILKMDNENPSVLREAAQLAVANEKFAIAAEYYQRLIKAEPNEREWRKMRAKTLTWAGRGREAVDLMRELHVEDPEDWELNLMLADLLLSLDEYEDALPVIDLLIAHSPDDDNLVLRKMNALMALKNFKEAAKINTVLVTRHPEEVTLVLKLAVNLVAANEFDASIPAFQQYLEEKPDDIEVRKQYAEALMAAQQFSAASAEYRTLLPEDTVEQDIRKKLANAQMAANDYRGAAETYGQLVSMFPDDREMNIGLVVSLRLSGQVDAALATARNYLSINPFDHKILTEAASMAMERQQTELAIEWYRTAVKLMPNDYKSRIALGNGLNWKEEYGQAESQFRQALCFQGDDFMARRGLARALFYQRKFDESFEVYQQITWDDPSDAICLEYKFRQAIANRQDIEAAKILAELQEIEPEDVAWRSDRYQSLLRQHRFPEARAQAKVVYEIEPHHRSTRKGESNMQDYLTTTPVTLRAGMLKKSSKDTDDLDQDRKAKLTYSYIGLHGEQSISDEWRLYADADREKWRMRENGVDDAISYRFRMGAIAEGNPNLRFKGDIGYRWFIGSDKEVQNRRRGIDDQWLYNLRAELLEITGRPLNIGLFSGRREHYDNYHNVYDNLYAYDFGIDAHYAWRKWDFNTELVGSTFSDTNSRFSGRADAKYRLYETPCFLLTVGANAEYESWKDTMATYYSPADMYKYGVDIDGRYYFCRDPETAMGTQSYIDFGLSFYRDRFSSNGQKLYLGVSHDYSTKLSAFARMDFSRESYYNEMKLMAGLTYKFGGCE